MFAVIFRAEINEPDGAYARTAIRMRKLATRKYGCSEFVAVTEGNSEIAISYWENEADILAWRQDAEHLAAQELGRCKWYNNYQVQVVKIIRDYKKTDNNNI